MELNVCLKLWSHRHCSQTTSRSVACESSRYQLVSNYGPVIHNESCSTFFLMFSDVSLMCSALLLGGGLRAMPEWILNSDPWQVLFLSSQIRWHCSRLFPQTINHFIHNFLKY